MVSYSPFEKQGLIVHPIGHEEEEQWNALMREHHYLGFKGLIGEQIKYVATLRGEWVALLGWAASSYRCLDRDQWIGWRGRDTHDRLKFIANNWRFLILPGVKVKNLASQILSRNLRRLTDDWEKKYQHPIFLAETFVDPTRFGGVCYQADNWLKIGITRGFSKGHDSYEFHGKKKLVFIKPLTKSFRLKLKGSGMAPAKLHIEALPIFGEDGLFALFKTIQDPRQKKGLRHRAPGLLVLCMLAILSGATGYKGIHLWIKTLPISMLRKLLIRNHPSESAIRTFLMRLNAHAVDLAMTEWLLKHIDLLGEEISFDGKTLKGSRNGETKALQLVSAVVSSTGIILSQAAVSEKTNEIPVVQGMIQELPVQGTTVTGDALHSQAKTSLIAKISEADAVFIFKDNQKAVKESIQSALDSSAFSPSPENSNHHG